MVNIRVVTGIKEERARRQKTHNEEVILDIVIDYVLETIHILRHAKMWLNAAGDNITCGGSNTLWSLLH